MNSYSISMFSSYYQFDKFPRQGTEGLNKI
ncbi:hypothetical protein V6Z12_D05G165500 [Gossypium hirsutum]